MQEGEQTNEFEILVLECDRQCENEDAYISCLSRCLQDKGFSEDEIKRAIRYIAERELEFLKALFEKS